MNTAGLAQYDTSNFTIPLASQINDFGIPMARCIQEIDKLLDVNCINGSHCNLTHAELEVTGLLVRGLTYTAIAEARNVSADTVKTQIANIYGKTNCTSRTELLILIAVLNGRLAG